MGFFNDDMEFTDIGGCWLDVLCPCGYRPTVGARRGVRADAKFRAVGRATTIRKDYPSPARTGGGGSEAR